MRHWFKDAHFRSLLKNSGYLAASKAVAAVAGIATLAIAGRGLGVELFGMLILITSYAKAASGLSKFQSWQLIVRYGGQALVTGEHEEFKASTGFAFALDVLSGLGGMLVAVMLLPFIGRWFGIDDRFLWLAMLYCTLLPTMGAATPIGVLRALDRFDLISWQGSGYPIVRAVLSAIAFALDGGFEAYVAIWFVTELGGDLYMWFLAWRELRRRGMLEGIRPTLRPETLPGAWRFAIHVNLTSSLVTAWGPVARLVVGGLLGATGAGLFRVASSLTDSAAKPADLLSKAFYPEVVRMDLKTKKPWNLMLRGTAMAAFASILSVLIILVVGKPLISLLFGKEFIGAYPIILVLIIAPLLAIISFPLPSMLYALDRPDAPLTARLIGTILFFVTVAPLSWSFGVIGAALAFVIGNAATVIVLVFQLFREYRRVRA
ncbi:lipopolysaccharide biosynthesis protein [Sphingomonas daechungensis]|uniref:lipopolysaccharide biosynthesis protein n=1 Tax=Sphingomonas daechungensis TaxID=1176646 RepID=UPI003784B065